MLAERREELLPGRISGDCMFFIRALQRGSSFRHLGRMVSNNLFALVRTHFDPGVRTRTIHRYLYEPLTTAHAAHGGVTETRHAELAAKFRQQVVHGRFTIFDGDRGGVQIRETTRVVVEQSNFRFRRFLVARHVQIKRAEKSIGERAEHGIGDDFE